MAEAENSVVNANQGGNSSTNETQVANQAQDGEVAQAGQEQQQQQQQRPGGWAIVKTLVVRMLIIYLISSFLRRPSTPQPKAGEAGPAMQPSANIYYKDMPLDMFIYLSESEDFTDYDDPKALFWVEEDIQYGNWQGGINEDGTYMKTGEIYISENVMNNGSLYMHVYFVSTGASPNPKDENYDKRYKVYKMKALNKYKKRRFHNLKNLITGTTETSPELQQKSNESTYEILSYWHPNQTINLIDDHTPWVKGSIPAPLDEYIEFKPGTNDYYPVLYFNDYWNMNSEYMPINETTPVLTLSLSYAPMSLFKWQMYAAQSMRSRWYSFMGESLMEENDDDQDSLKQTFLETSHWLLGITIVVSIIHSVFEFLAFKNDIQFWRNRKSLEGLSVRSVFFNVFQSVIIVLYVLDNETNFVVKVSVFIGLAIEIWKIHKVIDIKVDKENKLLGILPRITFQDKSTYTESKTKKYDMMAFKYLSWLLYPLLGGYAIYSLFYMEHKGYYSWILGMLYGFLLTFGFIMMTPQLFINYKLKSVAHLPWRMLTYKALNTFIDDLFAFVIKMPTLYRIACFRDDIVFCIYVYQRWIYRVDPKRVNEFGTSQDMLENDDQQQNGDVQPIEDTPAEQESLTEPTEPKPDKEKKED